MQVVRTRPPVRMGSGGSGTGPALTPYGRMARVGAVLEGFATIGTVIALGVLLAHLRVLDLSSQVLLSRLAFFVASPALMVTVLEDTDVREVFSPNLAATAVGVVVAGTAYVVVARLLFSRDLGDTVIGTLCSTYVNAGNLGLPIAAYVLGDVALVAPTLLLQMLVMQPIALAVLDHATTPGRVSVRRLLSQPFRTPLTVASLIGLALAVTGTRLPRVIEDPLALVGAMAVPAMLLAYGVSLRLGPKPGAGASPASSAWIVTVKLLLQPVAAYLAGRFVLGLEGEALLAVTVLVRAADRPEHLRSRDALRPCRGAGPRRDLPDHDARGAGDPGDHRPAGLIPVRRGWQDDRHDRARDVRRRARRGHADPGLPAQPQRAVAPAGRRALRAARPGRRRRRRRRSW